MKKRKERSSRTKASEKRLDIREKYSEYIDILHSLKTVLHEKITISTEKEQHKNMLRCIEDVSCEKHNGIRLGVELYKIDYNRFSLWIESDLFPDCHLVRFDNKGAAHRNADPDIPLKDQKVDLPHFHKYSENGYFDAHREECYQHIDKIDLGFIFFCDKTNIKTRGENIPEIEVVDMTLKLDCDSSDPNENITFA